MSPVPEIPAPPQNKKIFIGGAWNGGQLPAPTPNVHLFDRRDTMGLGIAKCGLRQEDRSNMWWWIDPNNEYQIKRLAQGDWPPCTMCFEEKPPVRRER